MHYLLIAGLLINSAMILINRYVKQLPDYLCIPIMLVGIGCIIAGGFLSQK